MTPNRIPLHVIADNADLVVFLLIKIYLYLSGVIDQTCNRVIYTDRSICAFKDSSVDISCTYSSYQTIRSKFWFSPERSHQWQSPSQPEDFSEDSQFAGRVQVLDSERGRSTLRITDLTESDSAQYHFKFTTEGFEWRSSLPGTTLTVTGTDGHTLTHNHSTNMFMSKDYVQLL